MSARDEQAAAVAESPQRTPFEARLEEYLGRPVVRRSCCGSERALADIAVGLRDEVARLRTALAESQARADRLAAQVAGVDRLLADVQPWADAADRTAGLKAKPAGLSAEDWNERYPVGTRVHAYPRTRDDAPLRTRTCSRAWTLGHGSAVVMVEGHSAGILLTHVDPVEAGDVS
ncbi:hypothetical protein [Streptomyces sp. NPDC047315]|uniref:hypothetical protein n=1 Tax=Streptomyces sp. NPDC047315 TaxID=3155142 RepID=UPI0033E5B0BF